MGNINYCAVHTMSVLRKVNAHQSVESAIEGKDGAAGLFTRKVRGSCETHGAPRYVLVWEQGAPSGFIVRSDPTAPNGIRRAPIPIADILAFALNGPASQSEIERYFRQ